MNGLDEVGRRYLLPGNGTTGIFAHQRGRIDGVEMRSGGSLKTERTRLDDVGLTTHWGICGFMYTTKELTGMLDRTSHRIAGRQKRDLKWALKSALHSALKTRYPELKIDELEAIDARPVLRELVATAKADSNANLHALVRRALKAISPRDEQGRPLRGFYRDTFHLPDPWLTPEWLEVIKAIDATPWVTKLHTTLRNVARVSIANCWMAPAEMPQDADALIAAFRAAGYSVQESAWMRQHYAEASRRLPNLLPPADPRSRVRDRIGILALATNGERFASPDDARMAVLERLAPKIAEEWHVFCRRASRPGEVGTAISEKSWRSALHAVTQVVRALHEGAAASARHWQTGEPLASLEKLRLLDLVFADVPRGRTAPVDEEVHALLTPEQRKAQSPNAMGPALWTVIRDGMSRLGAAPKSALLAHGRAVTILLELYSQAFPPDSADGQRFLAVVTTVHAAKEMYNLTKRKLDPRLLLERVQWHELVAFVLPHQASEARTARDAWQRALELAASRGHAQPHEHNKVRGLFQEYRLSSERYLALAIPTALPLRKSNFTFGSLGYREKSVRVGQWQLELAGSVREPFGIIAFHGAFSSHQADNPRAKLKRDRTRQEQKITQRVSPAIVDYDLLFGYLRDVRMRQLIACGTELPKDDPLGLTLGLPLFLIGGKPPSELFWLDRFKSALRAGIHWLRPNAERLTDNDTRGLFAIHRARTLFASFWFGIVDAAQPMGLMTGRTIARLYTGDTERTLAENYVAVSDTMKTLTAKLATDEIWENPRLFVALMAQAITSAEAIDWARVDMPRPPMLRTLPTRQSSKALRIARARPGQRIGNTVLR